MIPWLLLSVVLLPPPPCQSMPIAAAVLSITPQILGTFVTGVKSLFGSGNEFARRYGFDCNDIYNSQLLMASVNALNNEKQKEAELQQKQLMQEDLEKEHGYFQAIIGCLAVTMLFTVLSALIQLKHYHQDRLRHCNNKAIKEFETGITFKAIRDRIEGGEGTTA